MTNKFTYTINYNSNFLDINKIRFRELLLKFLSKINQTELVINNYPLNCSFTANKGKDFHLRISKTQCVLSWYTNNMNVSTYSKYYVGPLNDLSSEISGKNIKVTAGIENIEDIFVHIREYTDLKL